uniref:Cytochrome c oxidase subunit 3 n=1 Tax=Rhinebothrium sp. 1 TaxID=108307 RepID=A0A8K1W5I9_9CEST|nr:cytochrome c oxidase subunit III [Rhinebothrium sp. 1]
MSFLPIVSSLLAGLFVFTLFLWNVGLVPIIVILVFLILSFFWLELLDNYLYYVSAFWLFILSEIMAFGSILFCCFYYDNVHYVNLSSPLELPFLGCFILLGSSITITGFHHLMGWRLSWVLLGLTSLLGISFILLQMVEFSDIYLNILDSSFHASSFCTVGLHFTHVLIGVLGLLTILAIGVAHAGEYRCTLITWYWHFVDYIWLFVYTIVYVC